MAQYNVSKREAKKYGIERVLISGGKDKKSKSEKENEKRIEDAQKEQQKQFDDLMKGASPEVLNDPNFKMLTDDQKLIILYNEKIQNEDNEDKARKMDEAYNEAVAQSDPYMKNILRVAQDELIRGFDEAKGDFTSSAERLNRRVDEIQQDLAENKDFLSIEQQSELSRLAKGYETQRDTLVETHSLTGMTFSTKRQRAEENMNEEQKGIVESTKRQYNRKMADLQKEADRGSIEAKTQLEELQKQLNEDLTKIGRGFEEEYGTENLPPEILGIQGKQASGQPLTASEQQLMDNFQRSVDGNIALGGEGAKQFQGMKKAFDSGGIKPVEGKQEPQKVDGVEEGKTKAVLGRTVDRTKMREILNGKPKPEPVKQAQDFGYNPLGNVTGNFVEKEARDVEQRKNAIFNEKTAASINY